MKFEEGDEEGDMVTHRITGEKLVVIREGICGRWGIQIDCRRYNPVTGEYSLCGFSPSEFKEALDE